MFPRRRFETIHYVSCGVAQWAGPDRGCPGAEFRGVIKCEPSKHLETQACSVATGRTNASLGRELYRGRLSYYFGGPCDGPREPPLSSA